MLEKCKRWVNLSTKCLVNMLALLILLFSKHGALSQTEDETIVAPPGTSNETLTRYNEGLALINSGKYAEAAQLYAIVCKAAPSFSEAHLMFGFALMKMNRAREAESELLKADSLKPDMPTGLINLGGVYQIEGRYKEALAKFNRYLKLYPGDKHVREITGLVNALKTEQKRNEGATSSAGKDNYLSEAIAMGAARWRSSAMPLKIYIGSGAGVKGYQSQFADIVKQCFADWVEASQGKITISFTDDQNDASISCTWVDDPKQVVNPAEGGQAIMGLDTTGTVGKTKIKLLTQNPAMAAEVTAASMRHIGLHEIGHSLGLLSHSSQPGDIMFLTVNYSSPLPGLSERDKKTLFELYAAPDSIFTEHKIKTSEGAMLGSDGNPTNHALRLNGEGLQQAKAGHYVQALKLFEEALRLDPKSEYVKQNVAVCRSQMSQIDLNSRNYASAEKNMLLAAEEYQDCGKKDMAAIAYRNLAVIARAQGHTADVQKYETKAKSLQK